MQVDETALLEQALAMSMDIPQPSQSDAVISQPDAEMSDASIEDRELALGKFFDILVMLIATFILI